MAVTSQVKIRRDDYVVQWTWDDLQRLLRDDAERQLKELEVEIPDGGLTFMKNIGKVAINQLEEGGPPYKVQKWNALMEIHMSPPEMKS